MWHVYAGVGSQQWLRDWLFLLVVLLGQPGSAREGFVAAAPLSGMGEARQHPLRVGAQEVVGRCELAGVEGKTMTNSPGT